MLEPEKNISLFSSLLGLIVFLLASAIVFYIYGLKLYDMGDAALSLCIIALMVFLISGFVSGIKEKSKIGMVFSLIFLTAATALPFLYSKISGLFRPFTLTIIAIPIISMAIFAGLTALKISREKPLKIYKPLLILWFIPSFWCSILLGFSAIYALFKNISEFKQIAKSSHGLILISFGPWATIVAKLVAWPNAGESFSLPVALTFTAILIFLLAILKFANSIIRSLALISFASFILIWSLIAIGQLLNCLE
jgi:hypothetical protein